MIIVTSFKIILHNFASFGPDIMPFTLYGTNRDKKKQKSTCQEFICHGQNRPTRLQREALLEKVWGRG